MKFIVLFYDDQRAIQVASICKDLMIKADQGIASILDVTDPKKIKEYINGTWIKVVQA